MSSRDGPSRAGVLEPDICVVGAGSGGLSVAAAAAAVGVSVVLIERSRMGGDCLNSGCVPSKALIAAAAHASAIRQASAFGISAGEPVVDFPAVMRHVRDVIAGIAPFDSVERFEGLGVRVLAEEARFLDSQTLAAGPHLIRARRFVLATGSSPRVPDFPGLEAVPFLTNETLFDLDVLPSHLLILGGGPIGLEMAQAFRRLGSAVTVVDAGGALKREDPDLSAIVLSALRAEGVDLREHTAAEAVSMATGDRRGEETLTLQVRSPSGEAQVSASHLLVAVGRRPTVEALCLEAGGIDHGPSGIVVGRDLRTSNARVYAIGDVAGGPQFTHLANHHAGLVVRAILFRLPVRQTPDLVPRVTYTAPELGQVGLTAAEAGARGIDARVLTWPYADNDRARTERRTEGLLKMVVAGDGRLLGAGVAGAKAGELTNLFSLALAQRLTVRDLASFISPYPTYAEIGKRAATTYYAPYAKRSIVRAAVRLLSRLG
ncbi:MAG: FAD-dependent oxidoreductase [Rhizobiaceae bacterium]|nr:FAD-dependent oxidoreductase [Rhizobiaceae bacterium]